MRQIHGSSISIGLILSSLLVVVLFPQPFKSFAPAPPPLSAWTYSPPTIDGIINPTEWGSAASLSYTTGGGVSGEFYVMNDALNLYIALTTTDPTITTGPSVADVVFLYFDNNNNGIGPEPGDDIIGWDGYMGEGFKDGFSDGTYVWLRDTDYGGTSDGVAVASNNGTHNSFEIVHPLNTADDAHDFSLSMGDTVRFGIRLTVDGYDRGWWPSDAPSQWQGITVSDLPKLALENVKTWYWALSTSISSMAVGDVDGDGSVEIVTGGSYYDGTRAVAQLCVWSSSDPEVEHVTTWYWTGDTYIWSMAVADVDSDGSVEIITGGYYEDDTGLAHAQLCVWNGSNLALENVKTWYWTSYTFIYSVAVGDVDGDSSVEIITGGRYLDVSRSYSQLCVWSGSLELEQVTTWSWAPTSTEIYSVAIGDVDLDGAMEIVTGGGFYDGTYNYAQLCVWTGSNLALENVKAWYWTDDTIVFSVAVGDVDSDSFVEIVTGGYCYDGTAFGAQLCVWSGSTLTVENVKVWRWGLVTSIDSMAIGDVDADGSFEIITAANYGDAVREEIAQLCVWDGSTLALENVEAWYWISDTGINSVAVGDVDADDFLEIVTGGSYFDGIRALAQICVWSD